MVLVLHKLHTSHLSHPPDTWKRLKAICWSGHRGFSWLLCCWLHNANVYFCVFHTCFYGTEDAQTLRSKQSGTITVFFWRTFLFLSFSYAVALIHPIWNLKVSRLDAVSHFAVFNSSGATEGPVFYIVYSQFNNLMHSLSQSHVHGSNINGYGVIVKDQRENLLHIDTLILHVSSILFLAGSKWVCKVSFIFVQQEYNSMLPLMECSHIQEDWRLLTFGILYFATDCVNLALHYKEKSCRILLMLYIW